jgi:PAS domain S-box-containing protein
MRSFKQFEPSIEAALRRRIAGGFIVALLLTALIGFASWRGARLAEQDAYWMAHTHAVMDALELTTRHDSEMETSAQTFALTGQQVSLMQFEAAVGSVAPDEDALRLLTADNPNQQRRLDVFEPQVHALLEITQSITAERKKQQAVPSAKQIQDTDRLMKAVLATAQEIKANEMQLLGQRTQTAKAGTQWISFIIVVGAFAGAGWLGLAWLAINREIAVSARGREQLKILNTSLEQRVDQRTEALQSEVNERKRGEKALRESQELFRLLLDGVKDYAIYMLDPRGYVISWNTGAARIKGYGSEEILGKHFSCFYLPEDREAGKPARELVEAISKGRIEEQCQRVRKDGSVFWANVVITPMYADSGALRGFSKVARDITERRQVEEALHEQSQVLDLAQVMVRDTESRIVLWNLGIEKLYAFTREEAVGRISHELLHTEFPEPLELIQEQLERTGTWEGELVHRKRDGSRVVVSSLWVLHRDAKGNPTRVMEADTDITAGKEAKERLAGQATELARQAEELARSRGALETQTLMLQSVLDSMGEGLVAADDKLDFILWNPAAEKLLGLRADLASDQWTQHYGLYMADMVTPLPTDQIPLVRALRGEVSTTEMFVRNSDVADGLWIEVSAGPIRDKHGAVQGGVAALRDVTRSRADERKIRELNDELEHRVIERTAQLETANKELEAFSYSVSHDLRAPLRHIGGFSKLLMEEFGPTIDPAAQHYLERIHAGTQKMGLLVDELLNLARVGRHSLNRRSTRLNLVVAEVMAILQPESEGRQVDWVIADLPTVECDPVLVRQVFQNLLANALKFTGPRGGSSGSARAGEPASNTAVIEVSHKQEAGEQVFMVRDNGVGFNMKYVDKLFGVFQRLHTGEEFEGTGIGLVTVQRIVHRHGGRVWAEAEPGKGAAFYFTLGAREQVETKASQAAAGGQS